MISIQTMSEGFEKSLKRFEYSRCLAKFDKNTQKYKYITYKEVSELCAQTGNAL